MKISAHLTLREVTKSSTADRNNLDNTPTDEHLVNLKAVAENVFEPLRIHFGKPIGINSGYRSAAVNKAVKGSSSSQHCKGEAIDIDADRYGGMTNAEIFNYIKDNLDFDQMIWEFGTDEEPNWVHVSFVTHRANKKKLTRAHYSKPTYRDYKG